jgi:putative thiazole-containing bacteriocin maturation protein
MRPKLKSDTFFIPITTGVYVRNNEKSFTLKGKTLAAWLERLAPVLDGQYDLQDLCQGLPEEKRPIIEQLILTLAEQGCIKDTTSELPHTLSPAQLATYGPAITFIDYHRDSGAARFQRFLQTPLLAISSGEPLLALAHALLETGNHRISLLESGEATTSLTRLQEILQMLRAEQESTLDLQMADPDLWHNDSQLLQRCAASAMVLYFGRGDHLASVERLNTLCRQAAVPFVPALIWDDAIQIGPLCTPERPACWQCLWRRRRAAQGQPAYTADGQVLGQAAQEVRSPGKPAIGVSANLLAEACLTFCTQVDWQTLQEAYLLLETRHLQVVRHPLFPHPLCRVCSEQKPRTASAEALAHDLAYPAHPPDSQQRTPLQAWTDPQGGLFAHIEYAPYHQLPLTRCQVRVPLADYAPQAHPSSLPTVQACALDYPEAYSSAGRLAVAAYLESLADLRRACWGTWAQYHLHAIPPERIAGWLAGKHPARLAWVWGSKLVPGQQTVQGEPVLVPGAAVAVRSAWNFPQQEPLYSPEMPATGIATTWQEALADTLCRLDTFLDSSQEPALLTGQYATIPAHLYQHDQECRAYSQILQILAADVSLLDCPTVGGLPRVGAYLQGQWLGLFAHWHTLSAIGAALKQAVFSCQLTRTPGPEQAPPAPDTETAPRAAHTRLHLARLPQQQALRPSLAAATDYTGATVAMRAVCAQRAREIVVVPLPVDRTVKSLWPCALRVLALQTENEGKR